MSRPPLQLRRGLKANLPASAEAGRPYFCTDTHELYIGTGAGISKVSGGGASVTNSFTISLVDDIGFDVSISVGDLVACSESTTGIVLADNEGSASTTAPIGIALEAGVNGDVISVLTFGIGTVTSVTGEHALVAGAPVMASNSEPGKAENLFSYAYIPIAYERVFPCGIALTAPDVNNQAQIMFVGGYYVQTQFCAGKSYANLAAGTDTSATNDGSGTVTIASTAVKAATKAPALHQWLASYDATTGAFTQTQPAASDITGLATVATSGAYADLSGKPTIPDAQVQTDWNAVAGIGVLLNKPTLATVAASGAYADLTGAPSIPTSFVWNVEGNATADLTLANAGYNSTFNHTSAVTWKLANLTVATSSGTVSSSPILSLSGKVFSSGIDTAASWAMQSVMGAALSFTITNIAETAGNAVTLTIGTHSLVVGNCITITGQATTGTWLNNQNARITAVAATTITFQDPTSHGAQGSHAEVGTVTQTANNNLTFTPSGTAGDSRIIFPAGTGIAQGGSFAFAGQPAYTGFDLASVATGGLRIIIGSSASPDALSFYTAPGNIPVQRGRLSLGDTSGANSVLNLSTYNFTANFSVQLTSSYTNGTTQPGLMLVNGSAFVGQTGRQVMCGLGLGVVYGVGSSFAPNNGIATFQNVVNAYKINCPAVSGTITGVQVATNVVTLVFSDSPAFTAGLSYKVTAVTNTAINVDNATISTMVNRTGGTITNIVETSGNAVTLSIAGHTIVANDYIYLTGLTVGTWLNGKVAKVTSVSAGVSITFTDPTSHGTQASAADTGTCVCSYSTYALTTGNITLTTDTGTALQQAHGTVTGLLISAIETAVGGTHLLLDCQVGSAGTTSVYTLDNTGNATQTTPNGAQCIRGCVSELITLSTSGATTDSVGNLLPAGAMIEMVVARVTTTITTATGWKYGDGTIAGRFQNGYNSTMTAGTTNIGLSHMDQTGTSGPVQAAAAKLRITTQGTPGAGAIRVTVFYRQYIAPTS